METRLLTNWLRFLLLAVGLCGLVGCTWMSQLGTSHRGREYGKTYYVGGAGSVGNIVGTIDVPWGLRRAGYKGAIEVFAWQSMVGGTLRDLTDRSRNESQGRRLARRMRRYMDRHPDRPVNLIALSAGTGVATWALEALPERYHVARVVFLGSSMSRGYDLSTALQRIHGRLYNFYSTHDPVLRYMLPVSGSVDREPWAQAAAGLYGFVLPRRADAPARELYKRRLRNRPYLTSYAQYGYFGIHADSIASGFVQHVIAPLLMRPLDRPQAADAGDEPPATQPDTAREQTAAPRRRS